MIAKRNPKYRTKWDMAVDAHKALKSDMSYAAKHSVLKDICWTWTEYEGKYEGCNLRSAEANKIPESDWSGNNVIHEHVVPKKVVMDTLLDRSDIPSPECIFNYFTHFLIGVMVTIEEDKRLNSLGMRTKMPPEFYDENHVLFGDPFARHKKENIQLFQG